MTEKIKLVVDAEIVYVRGSTQDRNNAITFVKWKIIKNSSHYAKFLAVKLAKNTKKKKS